MAQSHKNQVHRIVLIDRALQQRSLTDPEGVEIGVLRETVGAILGSANQYPEIAHRSFDELWSSDKAFWNDLHFIKEHYPNLLEIVSNKLWRYKMRGYSLFPRLGTNVEDQNFKEVIMALDYFRGHPLAEAIKLDDCISTLINWVGVESEADGVENNLFFNHQFATEDAEVLTNENSLLLYQCMQAKRIVKVAYTSARSGAERLLEFHPWEFRQSEGRWYVAGFISADLKGNYPNEHRSDYPGLVLKLSEILSVMPLTSKELKAAEKDSQHETRYVYMDKERYSSLLDFGNRIGVGGWDAKLRHLADQDMTDVLFKLKQKALPYFKSCNLYEYTRRHAPLDNGDWIGFKVRVVKSHKERKTWELAVINRELLDLLRSFGIQLEVVEPIELRQVFIEESLGMASLYPA